MPGSSKACKKLQPWVERLIATGIAQAFADGSPHLKGLLAAIGEVYAEERRARQKEIETLRKEVAALEQRLLTCPGKLPVARDWTPETVTYQAEFVSHDGALWQARQDTARTPSDGPDWICVARAGRDGIDGLSLKVCGTYDAYVKYKRLDMVATDGASFVAKSDEPGICPGPGWQLLCRQGKPGRGGEQGIPGPGGLQGEKGEPGKTTDSWHVDREGYPVVPFMSDGTTGKEMNLRGLFEQFQLDVSEE